MDFLTNLWLPIVASAAATWIAGAAFWMALPHHKKDMTELPDQKETIEKIRALGLPPGNYVFPGGGCSKEAMKDPEVQRCWKEGPLGFISLWKTPPKMGPSMIGTFCVNLAVSITIGYLAWVTIGNTHGASLGGVAGIESRPGPTFAGIFQITGTAGILAYAFSHIPNGLWFGASRRAILMNIIDGVAYGLITGAIFAWLW
ncbi:MAG: hypothetical protein KIT19_13455 [Phycisphaeraceae bacterium]|nr:hypothetical protein [Phycisphaeraceae bacterium]